MKQLSFYLLPLLFISCNKEDNVALNSMDPNMNLENLKVGQKFFFLLAKGDTYEPLSGGNHEYTGDTLEIAVIKKVNNGHLLSEKFTDGSPAKLANESWTEDEFQNIWQVRNDSIVIEAYQDSYLSSHLMAHKSLPLQAFTEKEIQFEGRGFRSGGTEIAELFVKNYSLLGNTYDQLNVNVNNWGTVVDGPGLTTAYSKAHGIVKFIVFFPMTRDGHSWNRIR